MKIKEYKEDDYQTIFGVKEETFKAMLLILDKQYSIDHIKGGRKNGTTPRERLEITLKYERQYLSQRYLANEYGIGKSRITPIVKWVAKTINKSGVFSLPKKIWNINDNSESRVIDGTDSPIDIPVKNQKVWYSGKRKKHTMKTQVEIGLDTLFIYLFIQFLLQKVASMILNYLKIHHVITIKI